MLVVTFYSFKGGVGRTTLTTNVAVRLAEREQRVLLVDFDLEAPGFTYLDDLRPPNGADRPRGVAGFLIDSWQARVSADYRQYLYDLEGFNGRLAVMPAGAIESDQFGADLDGLHREEILNLSEPGAKAAATLTLLADLRQQWASDFDYVLIDSRTGFSDIGGICTRVLPDLVVAVLSLNAQGIEGTAQVLKQISSDSILGHDIRQIITVSMVPLELIEDSARALDQVATALEVQNHDLQVLPFFLPLLVQAQPFYAQGISPAEAAGRGNSMLHPLALAYERLLDPIRSENKTDAEYRLHKARSVLTIGGDSAPLRQLLEDFVQTPDVLPAPRVSRVLRHGGTLMLLAVDRPRRRSSDVALAVRALRTAVSLLAGVGSETVAEEYVQTVRELADALVSTSRGISGSKPELLEALELYQKIRDEIAVSETLDELGSSAQVQRQFSEAEQWYVESLEIKARLGDKRGQASSFRQLGIVAEERGQVDRAVHWYRQQLAIHEELRDGRGQANTLELLGTLEYDRRKFDEAGHWYRELLTVQKRLGNDQGAVMVLRRLAHVAEEQHQLYEAERWYREALETQKRLADDRGQATTLHLLGLLAEQSRELDEAANWYHEALDLERRRGDPREQVLILQLLGKLSIRRRRFEEAEHWYRESLAIQKRLGDEHGRGTTLYELRRVAEARGNVTEALELLEEAAAIFERTNDHRSLGSVRRSINRLWRKRRTRE